MSTSIYKRKITKSLEAMTADELKRAWLILKELGTSQKTPHINDKKKLEGRLAAGIRQLDKGKGTGFPAFLREIKKKYGRK